MLVIYYSVCVGICNVDEFLQVVFVAWCCVERDETAADIDGADCRGGRVFVVAVAAEECKGFLDFTFFFGGNVVFFGEFGSPFGGGGRGRSGVGGGGGRFAFGWLCDSKFSLLESLMTTSCMRCAIGMLLTYHDVWLGIDTIPKRGSNRIKDDVGVSVSG